MSSESLPELSPLAQSFVPGKYQHFKGGHYEALCVARDCDNKERELVVYRSLEKGITWIRPIEQFFDEVERDGYKGPRFRRVV